MQKIREFLENWQISIYFATVALAGAIAMLVPGTTVLEAGVNPALLGRADARLLLAAIPALLIVQMLLFVTGLSRAVPWERCKRPCSARSVRSRVHLADCGF